MKTATDNQALEVLPDLAEAINREHAEAVQAVRQTLTHAIRAGELLLAAKAQIEHGGFLPWLQANCQFSDRTARAYMRLAENQDRLPANWQSTADLTIGGALAMLAEPKFPQYEIHPAGMLFPWMKPDELAALARSIKGHGLISPIVLFEGKILDGKCRYEACRMAGVIPTFTEYTGGDPWEWEYVWDVNAERAHYTPFQVAMIYVKTCELVGEAEAQAAFAAIPALDAAKALRDIRDQGLYRATHETFDAYCQDRWGIGAKLLGAYGLA